MSADRLEKALEAMRNESIPADEYAGASARVWERLAATAAACAEFRPKLKDYLDGRMPESRRLLLEDHLGRCAECRQEFAVLKGERKVVAMPAFHAVAWPRWRAWAVAASLALVALYAGRHRIDALLAPAGPRMTVQMVSGDVYRVPEGALKAGTALGEGEALRTGVGSRAVVRLADGSAVEINERSELFVSAAWSGETIHLRRGDVIVQAAPQHRGRLRVETRDSVASVKGTVFAVSAGMTGSLVSVLEGSVEVTQPGSQRLLRPGEQAASNPALEGVTLREAVAWSKDSETYLALLHDFATIEKQIAAIPPPALRTQARLLPYLPADAVVYAAVPNLRGTIEQAVALAEQRAAESDVFRQWWNSDASKELREVIGRLQEVTPLLGEEIAFFLVHDTGARTSVSTQKPGGGVQFHPSGIPVIVAEVQAGKRDALVRALEVVRDPENGRLPYYVTDRVLVISDTPAHLEWALSRLGQGASGAFASEIARRYQRGAGWLLALDVARMNPTLDEVAVGQDTGAGRMKYMFLERRAVPGGEENEATIRFEGARMGLASWLASSGNSGAAEYISSDAVFAFAASTREPRQVFDEFTAQMTKIHAQFPAELGEAEAKLGLRVADDIVGALGTDFAVAIERLGVPVPGWVAALAVHQPSTLDATIHKLVDVANSHLTPEDQSKKLVLEQETVEGRVWNTLRSTAMNSAVTWTYDRGYLVAGADRALVARAIATRESGFPLIYSAAFRLQLPADIGLHPSGFAWLNTRGALSGVSAFLPEGAVTGSVKNLLSDSDPVLVVVNGEAEQIRASSRTRLTSLILDLMMADAAAGRGNAAAAAGKKGRAPERR